MQIRKLKTKDLHDIVRMLMRISGGVKKELTGMIVSQTSKTRTPVSDDKTEMITLALTVLSACYENAYDDFVKWLASLCEKTLEEYYELPVETTLELIDQLANSEDAKSFFSRAWQLFSKMNKSAGALNAKLALLNTTTE